MELLIVGGSIAVVVLVALAAVFTLQQRRSGTVKAVAGPRRGNPAPSPAIEPAAAEQDEGGVER